MTGHCRPAAPQGQKYAVTPTLAYPVCCHAATRCHRSSRAPAVAGRWPAVTTTADHRLAIQ